MFPCCRRLEGALASLVVHRADVKDPLLPNGLLGLLDEGPEPRRAMRVELLDSVAVQVCDLPGEDQAKGVGQSRGELFRGPGFVGVNCDGWLRAFDEFALLDIVLGHGLLVVVELVDPAHHRAEIKDFVSVLAFLTPELAY